MQTPHVYAVVSGIRSKVCVRFNSANQRALLPTVSERAMPSPHTLLTPEWLQDVRHAGLGIIAWHEERLDVLQALLRLGFSGICTDRLDLLRDAADSME